MAMWKELNGHIGDQRNAFVTEANTAVKFYLDTNVEDFSKTTPAFNPEFTHQFFGDNETVYGYTDLSVKLRYAACTLDCYMEVQFSSKTEPSYPGQPQPDDVQKIISEQLLAGYCPTKDQYCAALDRQSFFKPFGEIVHSVTVHAGGGEPATTQQQFFIYKIAGGEKSADFVTYCTKMQSFALWFIDAASYMEEIEDSRFTFYVIHKKCCDPVGTVTWPFVGYAAVYQYYAYPAATRPRIAQILVLPTYQRLGLGAHFLQTIYRDFAGRNDVLDITAEDPSENFVRLRDYIDCLNCLQLDNFQPEVLKQGFSRSMATEAQKKLRIGKRQARRVYEILRLKVTNVADRQEFRAYRLDVKRRLNKPLQKSPKQALREQCSLTADELKETAAELLPEQRLAYLENAFKQTVEDYRHTLDRLSMVPPAGLQPLVPTPSSSSNGHT